LLTSHNKAGARGRNKSKGKSDGCPSEQGEFRTL